ncbi:MAG: DUF3662 domain-containing protein [Chloroflexi bacterium]|nr:DUF3662 domain-containing protein [Chloroflexota bacterium]
MNNKKKLAQFEERIQAMVEGGFARLFAGRLHPREVALRLAHAMEDDALPGSDGTLSAPNKYVVHLHPEDYAALLDAQPDVAAVLAEHLVTLAQQSGFRLSTIPRVSLVSDDMVTLHTVLIETGHIASVGQATQAFAPLDPGEIGPERDQPRLPTAFLVVDGNRYIPLDRTVINIGRRRDNTIVLEDLRVSRQHCQLRLRFGQFVLYDLGSRGGTFVNEQRISECVLRAGDVISLAGVPLVYVVEDGISTGTHPLSDTAVGFPSADLDAWTDFDDLPPDEEAR